MALYCYVCECGEKLSRILKKDEEQLCKACGKKMARNPSPPHSQVVESLDNGNMPRKVERLADAERLYKDRGSVGRIAKYAQD